MNTTTRSSTAERFGRWLGRSWRVYARGERRASNWLASKGVPPVGSWVISLAIKLVVLGLLLYTAFWLALLVVFVVVAGWAANQGASEDDFELQFPSTLDEFREMPGYDPNLHNDTSHEMYREDD